MAFDADHALRDFAKEGCLVSRTGTQFEYTIFRSQFKRLKHGRDDVWLRNGLRTFDDQRPVFVSMLLQLRSNEFLTWNLAHSSKDCFARDSTRLELALDHELPRVHRGQVIA